mmetsp:Transcript_60764/g.198963  ORF Transcript_60764/g.198963 Transcript_60764/m.198963 type:complete len:205 (+) Transcript_60764:92-706(+)
MVMLTLCVPPTSEQTFTGLPPARLWETLRRRAPPRASGRGSHRSQPSVSRSRRPDRSTPRRLRRSAARCGGGRDPWPARCQATRGRCGRRSRGRPRLEPRRPTSRCGPPEASHRHPAARGAPPGPRRASCPRSAWGGRGPKGGSPGGSGRWSSVAYRPGRSTPSRSGAHRPSSKASPGAKGWPARTRPASRWGACRRTSPSSSP